MPSKEIDHDSNKKSTRSAVKAIVLMTALAAVWSGSLQAGDEYGYLNDAVITNNALSNIKGILGVNQAAGDLNLQANVRALSDVPGSAATAEVHQFSVGVEVNDADTSFSRIEENAFQNSVGLLSINQASGSGNVESNSIAISPEVRVGEIADDVLAAASLDVMQSTDNGGKKSSQSLRNVNVDETAFRGAKGVLQLNQAAGMHNVTRNRIVMQTAP